MDIWNKKKRSDVMSKNTKPEIIVRRALHKAGFRFRLHKKDLPGKPDIVLLKYKAAIFINGCFWHLHKKCREGRIPSTNSAFWRTKLEKNVLRDKSARTTLRKNGWRVYTLWECEIEKKPEKSLSSLFTFLRSNV